MVQLRYFLQLAEIAVIYTVTERLSVTPAGAAAVSCCPLFRITRAVFMQILGLSWPVFWPSFPI
jgi:hypothetical protein